MLESIAKIGWPPIPPQKQCGPHRPYIQLAIQVLLLPPLNGLLRDVIYAVITAG